jgi:hypothetical protein
MAAGAVAAHNPLADAAEELYALPLAEFTAARNERDKRARTEGDLEAARQIRLLAKPSAVAWAVNQLVREPGAELGQFLDLGDSLRAAQDSLDRDSIRELTSRRRKVVSALAGRAVAIATGRGHSLSGAAAREIEQTLEAALADAAAADAVTSGRLLRGLSSVGFDPVDLSDAVAVPGLAPVRGGAIRGTSGGQRSRQDEHPPPAAETAPARTPKRELEKARRELEDAAGRAEDAAAELDALTRRMDAIARKRESLTAELDALKSTASGLEAELRVLEREASSLVRQRTESSRAAVQAKRAATRAAGRLDELS